MGCRLAAESDAQDGSAVWSARKDRSIRVNDGIEFISLACQIL